MNQLADFIQREHDVIAARWVAKLQAGPAARALDIATVLDSLVEFMRELTAGLQQRVDVAGAPPHPPVPSTVIAIARSHGTQRFDLGYDLASVIREYGTFRDVVFALLDERGVQTSLAELRGFTSWIVDTIAEAATAYGLSRDRAQQELAAKHAGFMAHELRNPASSARLSLDLLRNQGKLPAGKPTEVLDRSLRRLNELIDRSLVTARLQVGGGTNLVRLDLVKLLGEILDEARALASSRSVSVVDELQPGLSMEGDETLLYSAVGNVLRNAVKFTRPESAIVLRARGDAGRVFIEVEDSCGGLPENAQARIFDPWVQIGQDRSGLGLGLAIAKQAVEAHLGALRLHNLPGKGCVFVFDLPANSSATTA